MPLGRFLAYAFVGCAVFCFGLTGAGWAVGSHYKSVRSGLDYAAIVLIIVLLVYFLARWRRRSRLAARASDSAS
jgi:membrane protein DedA with SNARE-associated domain